MKKELRKNRDLECSFTQKQFYNAKVQSMEQGRGIAQDEPKQRVSCYVIFNFYLNQWIILGTMVKGLFEVGRQEN